MFELLVFGFLICGAISAVIGSSKNRSGFGSFFWGFFLGVIGIIVVALLPPGIPPAPRGMYPRTCARCNARQNIPTGVTSFDCWQCHTTNQVKPILTDAQYRELKRRRKNGEDV